MIEYHAIKQRIKPYISPFNYKEYNFIDLSSLHPYFVNSDGITFEDAVGSLHLTGNELIYYPELAKELQEIKDYPILKRTYPLKEKKLKGMDLITYFAEFANISFGSHTEELKLLSSKVDDLISKHGNKRQVPIVNDLIVINYDSCPWRRKQLIVNGVAWHIKTDANQDKLPITSIFNLRTALNAPYDYTLEVEDAKIGTSYIAVRIAQSFKHKGHVEWYDLNTLEKVSRTVALKTK